MQDMLTEVLAIMLYRETVGHGDHTMTWRELPRMERNAYRSKVKDAKVPEDLYNA